ncbi:MAG: tail fiber domain-containing protein [Phycisphaerales bacterium]|nr:tail fiber domain-containing protein [Phycisphaerales bacterium]
MSITRSVRFLSSLAVAAGVGLFTASTLAQTYTSTGGVSIPVFGSGFPYPNTINVTGAPSSIEYISVKLEGVTHGFFGDVNVLLVSPTGEKISLIANTNGTGVAFANVLTFIPDGTATLPTFSTNVVSGVYACSSNAAASLPSPAPPAPYETSLTPLIGKDPNGSWKLYISDDGNNSAPGSISRWSITFNQPPAQQVSNAFTYQGKLVSAGVPVTGPANVRFTLCGYPTFAASASDLAPPITRNFTNITDGVITTTLDFGSAIQSDQALWLNIEVESPPGSGFVTLSPRQAINAVPQARLAQSAVTAFTALSANNATSAGSVPWTGVLGVPANITGAFSPWVGGSNSSISYTAGNVGIGTTSPTAKLHVQLTENENQIRFGSPSNFGTVVSLENSSSQGRNWLLRSNGFNNYSSGAFELFDATSNASRFIVTPSGFVGMGTNLPGFNLDVRSNSDTQIAMTGGPEIGGNVPARTWSIQSSSTNNGPGNPLNASFQIVDRTANASRMLIDANGNVGIGTTSPSQRLTVAGNVVANNVAVPSSGRFKHNVAPMTDALDKLLKLEGVSFDWNPDFAKDRPGREHDIGFVAEDVAKVFPEVVFFDAEGKVTGMDYSRLTAVAIQAIKQQQLQREADRVRFEEELKKRDAQNAELKARLERLERALNTP